MFITAVCFIFLIMLQETVEAEEFDKERWTKLKCGLIVFAWKAARTSRKCGFVSPLSLLCEHYGKGTTGSPSSLYEPHKEHNMASNYKGLYGIFNKISKEVDKSGNSQ